MATKISSVKNQTTAALLWNAYDGNPFNDEGITKIIDNMENVDVPVTSIPSPYAQMHLFVTAFSEVNSNFAEAEKAQDNLKKVLDGTSTYHKVISDCLDIYELLYSYEILSLKGSIVIKTWDDDELEKLKESKAQGQVTFAKTLEVYGHNYSQGKRFNNMPSGVGEKKAFDQFILIFYKDRILAGGSPLSGFFMNREISLPKIKKLDGKEFFSENIPLYRRDLEFQIFLNIFFSQSPGVQTAFPELNVYRNNNNTVRNNKELNQVVDKLNNMSELPEEYIAKYDLLNIGNAPIYLLGALEKTQYKYKPIKVAEIEGKLNVSDYRIRSSKNLTSYPLALIEGSKKKHWNLFDGPLEEDIDLRKDLEVAIEERKIPGTNISYPYLQLGDVLADHIIQLSYDINEECFWAFGDQGYDTSNLKNILLPLKPTYFRYFTVEDLKEQLFIECLGSGAITVQLRIPVLGDNGSGSITYEKLYVKSSEPSIKGGENRNGAIVGTSLGLGIYPFIKVDNTRYNDQYKIVQYYDTDVMVNSEFFRENKETNKNTYVNIKDEFIRTRKEENQNYVSKYTELSVFDYNETQGTVIHNDDVSFDLISLKINTKNVVAQGIVFPLFSKRITPIVENTKSMVAFDIGTSSTHVVCATNKDYLFELDTYNESSKGEGLHLAFLHKPEYEFNGSEQYNFNSKNIDDFSVPQLAEFLPSLIGSAGEYTFPIPTVINEDNDTDTTRLETLRSLTNINIPFAYGMEELRTNSGQGVALDNLYSNLKWDFSTIGDNAAKNRLRLFIDQLVWMARNKIISKGLNPELTELIWFKPLSMGTRQRNAFDEIWNSVYEKYFGKSTTKTKRITSITESWAPFFGQVKAYGAGKIYLNIDIGGGTTDILIFKDDKPSLTTSFRFAGNALFNGGLNKGNGKDNGFYIKYKHILLQEFQNDIKAKKIIHGIDGSEGLLSTDMISYFFRLKEFRDRLKLDEDFQVLFLLHNAAIFYHAAQLMKMGGYEIPHKIGLSGNGARLVSITNRDLDLNRYQGMSEMVSKIFSHVFDAENEEEIDLEILADPKKATAEGGIKGLQTIKGQKNSDERNFKIGFGDANTLLKGKRELADYGYSTIRDSEEDLIDTVVENVCAFIDMMFNELWFEVDFTDSFGLSKTFNRKKLREYFSNKNRIRSSIRTAINNKINQEGVDEFSETLFFYPIIEMIFHFSKVLVNEDESNKYRN
ncbi:hypothetical protein [Spongiimicrobium salis]|uniref:hypothetical protein n=1 Tax=Spongiimicrobium salis TaxID=1667022 RepID=UPI00374D9545